MATKRRKRLSDQVRAAIDGCGVTRYRIAKDTGISQSMLSKFMGGTRDLSMPTLDTLAEYLRLRIVADKRPPQRKGK